MRTFDTVTWQALTLLLTVGCLAMALVAWRRRRRVGALRWFALALLPPAAYLTGTLRLVWEIGDALVSWAVRLAFTPTVWVGVVLAGVAVLLLVTAGFLGRRGAGQEGAGRRPRGPAEVEPKRRATPDRERQDDDGLDEVEEILRRHGIT